MIHPIRTAFLQLISIASEVKKGSIAVEAGKQEKKKVRKSVGQSDQTEKEKLAAQGISTIID